MTRRILDTYRDAPEPASTAPACSAVVGSQPASEGDEGRPSLVADHSEPGDGLTGGTPVVAQRQGGEEPGTLGSLSAAPSNIVRIPAKPLRPYCLAIATGAVCGSPGGRKHCFACERAHAAEIRVEPGGEHIPHQGVVRA